MTYKRYSDAYLALKNGAFLKQLTEVWGLHVKCEARLVKCIHSW